jgi:hypothetical protein
MQFRGSRGVRSLAVAKIRRVHAECFYPRTWTSLRSQGTHACVGLPRRTFLSTGLPYEALGKQGVRAPKRNLFSKR